MGRCCRCNAEAIIGIYDADRSSSTFLFCVPCYERDFAERQRQAIVAKAKAEAGVGGGVPR